MPNSKTLNNGGALNARDDSAAFRVSASIAQQIVSSFKLSAGIAQSVFDTEPDFTNTSTWTSRVVLGGEDISDRLTGEVTVEAEEDSARIAQFNIVPNSGVVEPESWTGASVTVDFMLRQGATITYVKRLFTGVVDLADYDPIQNIVRFDCNDELQRLTDQLTRAQIDERTPFAKFNPRMVEEDVEGFEYLEERLVTAPRSYDLDAFRRYRVTPWAAKGTADYEFSASQVVDESIEVQLAQASEVVNEIEVDFTYRYTRLKERTRSGAWRYPASICQYLQDNTNLPNRDMIVSALRGTGWEIKNISYTSFDAGISVYECSTGPIFFRVEKEVADQLVLGASWTLFKRFSQNIEERYSLIVRAPQSSTALEPRKDKITGGFTAQYDDSEWRTSEDPESFTIGTSTLGGSAFAGDVFIDKDDVPGFTRDDAEESIEFLICEAKRNLLDAHRQNSVSFDCILNPDIDLVHTVRIATALVTAKGKARNVVHTMDLQTGRAHSTITLAISKPYGNFAVGDTPIVAPEKPESENVGTPAPPVVGFTTPSTSSQFGGRGATYDPEKLGFSGNYTPETNRVPGEELFPVRFRAEAPAIDDEDVNTLEVETTATYNVSIPDDELVLTAP